MKDSLTNRQTDGPTNMTDFRGKRPQGWRFDVFRKYEIKFSRSIWLDCEPYGENQYKKKEHNQHNLVFKEFKNNDP